MFVIVSALCVFVAGLEALSEMFVRGVEFHDDVVSDDMTNRKPSGVIKDR